ncbi:MAG: DUF167 domain-containing protein [Holosporales bacterium]|jgi:uncharacterized protein (TIGR00251 family)|nr:DUF167 domain-containing protein [Holosporales bacterium]
MLISVKVTPKASTNAVVSFKDKALQVKVTAAPENNKANEALIKIVSNFLRVPKSKIQIISGLKSRHKTLSVETDDIGSVEAGLNSKN